MGSLIRIVRSLAAALPLAALVPAAALAQLPVTPSLRPTVSPVPFDPRAAVDGRMIMADNLVEFYHPKALGRFFAQWNARGHQISVVHFGDSHVQLGWLVAPIRQRLQAVRGDGGRGMVFPYAIAKTYSQEDFTSTFSGLWRSANSMQQPPKLGVGLSGFVATTNDPAAGFAMRFKGADISLAQEVSLYYRVIGDSYRIDLVAAGQRQSDVVAPTGDGRVHQLRFPAGVPIGELSVQVSRLNPVPSGAKLPAAQVVIAPGQMASFEIHGLDLRLPVAGLTYHNLGVGGAAYKALLQQKYFEDVYPFLKPDLVILDWGTNDIIYKNEVPPDLADTVIRTIQRIRAIDPDVTILLTNVQDMAYRGRSVTAAAALSSQMRRIAREQNCLFYDWYRTSGGPDTIDLWLAAGFASKDRIHLNGRGYRKRGEALADALMRTIAVVTTRPDTNQLVRDAEVFPQQSLK